MILRQHQSTPEDPRRHHLSVSCHWHNPLRGRRLAHTGFPLEGGSRYRGLDPVWSNRLGDCPQAFRHWLAGLDAAVRSGEDTSPCAAAVASG